MNICICIYLFWQKTNAFTGDLETFAQHFMNNEGTVSLKTNFSLLLSYYFQSSVPYTPYFPHVINAWNKRHHPNMHFMFYEDMKRVIIHIKSSTSLLIL